MKNKVLKWGQKVRFGSEKPVWRFEGVDTVGIALISMAKPVYDETGKVINNRTYRRVRESLLVVV